MGQPPLMAAAVGVLLQDEHGRVLLQRRGDDGLWSEPGGALEPGEDFLTGARRELLEETGLDCPNLTLLPLPEGLQDGPELFHRYPNGHEIYIIGMRAHGTLPAAALERAAPDDSGETLELQWFPLDALPDLSNNANRASLNVLRARAGLPPLPLMPTPPAPPVGNFLMDLRRVIGPRPWFAPGSNVLVTDDGAASCCCGTGTPACGRSPAAAWNPARPSPRPPRGNCTRRPACAPPTWTRCTCSPDPSTASRTPTDTSWTSCRSCTAPTASPAPSPRRTARYWTSAGSAPTTSPENELSGELIRANLRWWRTHG